MGYSSTIYEVVDRIIKGSKSPDIWQDLFLNLRRIKQSQAGGKLDPMEMMDVAYKEFSEKDET